MQLLRDMMPTGVAFQWSFEWPMFLLVNPVNSLVHPDRHGWDCSFGALTGMKRILFICPQETHTMSFFIPSLGRARSLHPSYQAGGPQRQESWQPLSLHIPELGSRLSLRCNYSSAAQLSPNLAGSSRLGVSGR